MMRFTWNCDSVLVSLLVCCLYVTRQLFCFLFLYLNSIGPCPSRIYFHQNFYVMQHCWVPIWWRVSFPALCTWRHCCCFTDDQFGQPDSRCCQKSYAPSTIPNGLPSSAVKTRMCNKYNTADGCKFGEKCHFAHGEWELGKPIIPSHDGHMAPSMGGRFAANMEPPQPTGLAAATSFGASATAKISVDASLAGAIIGKGGMNTKQICRITGVKLAIREHESDPNLRNIELEGTFDQIKHASSMVRELIVNVSSATSLPPKTSAAGAPNALGSNYKTKLCDNFTKGSCTFGDRCHFAHGASELRKTVLWNAL